VGLLPGRRRLLDLARVVVEEAGVRVERHGLVLAVDLGRVERGRDELALARLDGRRDVAQPALGRKLGGPDDVHAGPVAPGRLGLLALDELGALSVSRGRELEQLGVHARVLLVVELDHLAERAGGVLADAPSDAALGVLGHVRCHGLGVAANTRDCRAAGAASPATATTGRYGGTRK